MPNSSIPSQTRRASWRVLLLGFLLLLVSCGDSAVGFTNSGDLGGPGEALTRPLPLTEPSETPPVDVTLAEVGLETIVFDTFDGGSVTLAEADDATIDRLFDAISPIDAPEYDDVAEGDEWLTADDLIVGYVDQASLAWAYPVRILNSHEIVNDELSGQPILISYCPLCGSGVVFDRELDGQELSFSNTSALHQNDMVMVDRETGSYWWQLAGRGLVGELSGRTLEPLPGETTSWESWRDRYPDTLVMRRPAGRSYDRDSFARIAAFLDAGQTPFPVDADVFDDERLAPSARVVIVEVGDEVVAYQTDPQRTIEDSVDGVSLTVTADGVGAVVTGPDGPLPVRYSFWYAALAAFPEISVRS